MIILTIDAGTTNTRVCLWKSGVDIAAATRPIGVRDTAISGSVAPLRQGVRDTIADALEQGRTRADEVNLVLASGMITSNLGLHEIPHVIAPAGIREIADCMQRKAIPDVFAKPIWFVPGVRNDELDDAKKISLARCEAMDMMRGEEVEVIGLINRLGISGPAIFVMPGSHTKFVSIDAQARITGSATTLAGELLQAITSNTILAKTLQNEFAEKLDAEKLLAGAALARKVGLGRVCFSTRILDLFGGADRNGCANFLLGAVLASDLHALQNSEALAMQADTRLIVAGTGLMQEAMALLISNDEALTGEMTVVSATAQRQLAGFGAICVARARGLLAAPTLR